MNNPLTKSLAMWTILSISTTMCTAYMVSVLIVVPLSFLVLAALWDLSINLLS